MRKIEIITKNPFRILGVTDNATAKKIAANAHRISAYQKVGKTVSFPLDLEGLLGKCKRTESDLSNAQASINLPANKIKYALFWFVKIDNLDSTAINNLMAGNVDKAISIWQRSRSFSGRINLGVLSLINNDFSDGIQNINSIIHNKAERNEFTKVVCGENFVTNEQDLSSLFINTLLTFIKPDKLLSIYKTFPNCDFEVKELIAKVAGEYESTIADKISEAAKIDSDDAYASYQAGLSLMNSTKTTLHKLSQILGKQNITYMRIADKLALQILQCGINYFNNTSDIKSTAIDNAFVLQEYATNIAEGRMAKDRCQKNLDILKKLKEEAKIETDLSYIASQLSAAQSGAKTIYNARNLIDNCKAHLNNIRIVLGSSNEDYLKLSSTVINLAFGITVDVINKDQNWLTSSLKDSFAIITEADEISSVKSHIDAALSLFSVLLSMDMIRGLRERITMNKNTLLGIKDTVDNINETAQNLKHKIKGSSSYYGGSSGNSSGSGSTSYGGSSRSSSSSGNSSYGGSSGSDSSSGSGCMVVITALIIISSIIGLLI